MAGELQMLGTSGTITTLCGVHLELPRYDRARVDGASLDFATIDKISESLAGMGWEERAAIPCIGRERADLVVAGCAILAAICRLFPVGRLRVADRGVREGILMGLLAAGAAPGGDPGVRPGVKLSHERAAPKAGRIRAGGRRCPRAQRARADPAGAHHRAQAALLDPLARAPAERPLCRRGPAPGLPLPRRLQAAAARRPLPSPGAGQEGDRPGRRPRRLDPGGGGALLALDGGAGGQAPQAGARGGHRPHPHGADPRRRAHRARFPRSRRPRRS